MRIEHYLRIIVAVLSLAAVLNPAASSNHNNHTLPRHSRNKGMHEHNWYWYFYKHDEPLHSPGDFLTLKQNQELLRHERNNRSRESSDCCPSVLEMVEPLGGKNQNDVYVELFRDGTNIQRFYELSCHKDILNRPCRFIDRRLHNNSLCVQKYSYTYALVKDVGSDKPGSERSFPSISVGPPETRWTLDYIRVRSGCSCEVRPQPSKKKRTKGQQQHGTSQHHRKLKPL